ncbi:alanine-tRNA ligase [Rhynchospora pubera]|uniref:Alanine-tRNA ligase n=1 Tax=Rhynchospora pubera TaxID=906938 RepID=A0AAV8CG05_9POAL|nr:alanine-tRNA ligase [Rhynchospora pubera]
MASEGPARSSQPWPLNKIDELIPSVRSQCDAYVDQFVNTVKDKIKLVQEHPVEATAVATVSGLVLLRAPRRFLIRNTLGRFKTEKDLLNEAESRMKQLQKSLEDLRKVNSGVLKKTEFGEEDILRGSSNMRSSGKQIQSLVSSIYKAESSAADLMHRLRSLPGRESIELRAEVGVFLCKIFDKLMLCLPAEKLLSALVLLRHMITGKCALGLL